MAERLRAHQLPAGQYPPTTRGLAKYLQETEGLEKEQAVRVVRAVFAFVKMVVLEYGQSLSIYMFGTFRRSVTTRDTQPSLGVRTTLQYVLKFTASQQYGRVRLSDDDEA